MHYIAYFILHPRNFFLTEQYIAERNDIGVSAQIRSRLSAIPANLCDLSDMCMRIEHMDVELRELNQRLRQTQ